MENLTTNSMIDNMVIPNIRLFIFGTLRKGGKFEYYMEGSSPIGLYYTKGQLMESTVGSAYINFDVTDARTLGEMYLVNYACLQRIHHLENASGEFPKGYDLDLIPVWPYHSDEDNSFREDEKYMALFYHRRDAPLVVKSGDWLNRKNALNEIHRLLSTEFSKTLYPNDVMKHIISYLRD